MGDHNTLTNAGKIFLENNSSIKSDLTSGKNGKVISVQIIAQTGVPVVCTEPQLTSVW